MKAVTHERYGGPEVLHLEEIEQPKPKSDEVLIRVVAPPSTAEEVGEDVTEFAVGDRVFGVNSGRFGAHAEYMCMRAGSPLATMPDSTTSDEAASLCDDAIMCGTPNLELPRSLSVDDVIDYLNEDFTKNGQVYDVIFDAVGKHSFRRCRRSLAHGGTFVETAVIDRRYPLDDLVDATRYVETGQKVGNVVITVGEAR